MSTCRSCGESIDFAITPKGHRLPLNMPGTHPDVTPNLIVWRDRAGQLRAISGKAPPEPENAWRPAVDAIAATSHFATCPNAKTHRRSRK